MSKIFYVQENSLRLGQLDYGLEEEFIRLICINALNNKEEGELILQRYNNHAFIIGFTIGKNMSYEMINSIVKTSQEIDRIEIIEIDTSNNYLRHILKINGFIYKDKVDNKWLKYTRGEQKWVKK